MPTYCILVVVNQGEDLPSVKNHSDYVNAKGKYDIVEFITDCCKYFKYLYNVAVGQLEPHITTGQDGYLSHPNISRNTANNFQILVMEKSSN